MAAKIADRTKRKANPGKMRITDTDLKILRWVYMCRMLTQDQIQLLVGDKHKSQTQKRLRRLFDHSFLRREEVPVTQYGNIKIYHLVANNQTSRELLWSQREEVEAATGEDLGEFARLVKKDLSGTFMEHTEAENQVRICTHLACENLGWELPLWVDDFALKQTPNKIKLEGLRDPITLIPDGYFVIQQPGKQPNYFFLELDRDTMTDKRFKHKVRAYIEFYKSRAFNKRYQARGFRVVTVVSARDGRRDDKRVNNLWQISNQVQRVGKRFWFCKLSDLNPETVLTAPIWTKTGHTHQFPLLEI